MGNFFGGGSNTTEQTLDPAAQNILQQIIAQTNALSGQNLPFVAPFDAATVQGLQQLQDRPQSEFITQAGDQLSQTLTGGFQGQNPAVSGFNTGLDAVTRSIQQAAQQSVGDQFSAAGRSGSPAQSIDLARTVSNQLAPFQFGAFQQQQQLQSQAFENERQRQLAALGIAPSVEGLQDAQSRRLLDVGGIIQNQNQATLSEPFQAFQFALNPLLSAVGGFPLSQTTTNRASGSQQVQGAFDLAGSAGDFLGLFGF